MAYDSNKGAAKLGAVISKRVQEMNRLDLDTFDFGVIQDDYSLKPNHFEKPIPKGNYSLCRQLTLGETGEHLTYNSPEELHAHDILIPEKMRSLKPGDRVLLVWVRNEATIIDIVLNS